MKTTMLCLCLYMTLLAAATIPLVLMAADNGNFIISGETLRNDQKLEQSGYSFVMQGDCNLVLYRGWQSNTANRGTNCYLSLDERGQLTIKSGSGSLIWSTNKSNTKSGEHVAVLHPHGNVVVYGPKVWSTRNNNNNITYNNNNNNMKQVDNLLFSGQVLHDDGELVGGGYTLIMQGDCNLVLYKGWQSNTAGNGKDCFLRLDHYGGIRISDGVNYNKVWSNNVKSAYGDYVAVVNSRGDFSVYGPAIWSTSGSVRGERDEDDEEEAIQMVV